MLWSLPRLPSPSGSTPMSCIFRSSTPASLKTALNSLVIPWDHLKLINIAEFPQQTKPRSTLVSLSRAFFAQLEPTALGDMRQLHQVVAIVRLNQLVVLRNAWIPNGNHRRNLQKASKSVDNHRKSSKKRRKSSRIHVNPWKSLRSTSQVAGSSSGCFGLCAMSASTSFRRSAEALGCLSCSFSILI